MAPKLENDEEVGRLNNGSCDEKCDHFSRSLVIPLLIVREV